MRDYRLIDLYSNLLLLKTDDYKSILRFVVKHINYKRSRYLLLEDNREIEIGDLIKLKTKIEKNSQVNIYADSVRNYSDSINRHYKKNDIDSLLNELE